MLNSRHTIFQYLWYFYVAFKHISTREESPILYRIKEEFFTIIASSRTFKVYKGGSSFATLVVHYRIIMNTRFQNSNPSVATRRTKTEDAPPSVVIMSNCRACNCHEWQEREKGQQKFCPSLRYAALCEKSEQNPETAAAA